ncbi:sugar ABC transporter ATP-binding protein [Labrys monachus]|uniref:ABC-type sugar transport system ATPase subunit n=1 Tax=Labrys monachus TaxID=217067 RepID=A0ABU0FG30_9HYPH|nr:sugar ABC transporter ATP-binding protein [Labrys monachus]MDQ0393089.1 ABC-type sugar transport system ATPase subunit [Labrys monachus]
MPVTPALQLRDLGKSFGGFWALRNVTIDFQPGEVHAIVGENGAGKSTLIKLVAGVHHPSEGAMTGPLGTELRLKTPRDALKSGIGVVHQELDLFDNLTVAENIALGIDDAGLRKPSAATMAARARKALRDIGEERIAPGLTVGDISTSDKQLVAIAKVLTWEARVIILDEPTSALNAIEAARLLDRIRHLRSAGVAVIYVSHKLGEIFSIADRISVIRDGTLVTTGPIDAFDHDKVVHAMLGRQPAELFPAQVKLRSAGDVLLRIDNMAGRHLDGVSFDAKAGEIVALAGLPDAGPSSLLRHIFGLDRATGGTVTVAGRPMSRPTPREAIGHGIAYLPADRLREGILPLMDVVRNTEATDEAMHATAAALRRRKALQSIRRLSVRTASLFNRITSLSGGNQQKTLLARWLVMGPKVLMLDDPTRGVDVGAKSEIYQILRGIADAGAAVIFTSSDSLELARLSDRILLFRQGRVVSEIRQQVTHAELDRAIAAA